MLPAHLSLFELRNLAGDINAIAFIQILNVAQPSGKFWVGLLPRSNYLVVTLTSNQSGVAVVEDHFDIIGNGNDLSFRVWQR